MSSYGDFDWDEAWEYQPGFTVELNAQPGVLHRISSYDPMLVPPISLDDDPRPRYPHELRVVSRSTAKACPLKLPAGSPAQPMCAR
ncbi:hypothetical protein IFO70_00930 [Phormidium tenue FACHB-886]|nr:hypothetical protein [Phormidium tenue FACHB-886]